jgi:hypothetical protein
MVGMSISSDFLGMAETALAIFFHERAEGSRAYAAGNTSFSPLFNKSAVPDQTYTSGLKSFAAKIQKSIFFRAALGCHTSSGC